MEIDGHLKRGEKVKSLTDQPTDHSCQHIPRPSRGHSRISRWVDEDLSFGGGDQRAMSFEDEIDMMGLGEISADARSDLPGPALIVEPISLAISPGWGVRMRGRFLSGRGF